MKASEMTNEELANELEKPLVGSRIVIEAVGRLRKPCTKNYKCDSLEEMLSVERRKNADLRRSLKAAEAALEKCSKVNCEGSYDRITCEDCDLACDGRCAQWLAKKTLAALTKVTGESER